MNSITEIARIAHEANRFYCESLGDFSQDHWNCCEQWQRDSSIEGVRAIKEGHVTKPEESHVNWLRVKENEGWLYGPKKDVANKFHPCMVPFDELSKEQQMKDHLFFVIVTTLLGSHVQKETLRQRFDNFLSPAIKRLGTNEYNQLLDNLIKQC